MLNPPLSLLSDDLLVSIVEYVAKLPSKDENLYNLSLVDRAFTQSCQKYIFRNLKFSSRREISKNLINKAKKLLDEKPSFATQIRMVELLISRKSSWIFNDHAFIRILQLLSKSPRPPHELHFGGHVFSSFNIEDPILVVRQLAESFFAQSLTILRLTECANVPLPLFLICPRLREVFLDNVGATDKSYYQYPDNLCSGREAPSLEVLDYRNSCSLVKQMITPPPRFNITVVLWSSLCVLTLSPHDIDGMAFLQPILDAACNTLEELHLTGINMGEYHHLARQLSLARLVNLRNLQNLQVFSLCAIIKSKALWNAQRFAVLHDINIVLGTIPESNKVTNLWFDFMIVDQHPFHECLDQNWVGMFNEIIRISDGKPLELEFQMVVSMGFSKIEHSGQAELFVDIMKKAASLSDHPKICTHFWNPTFGAHGPGPFPRGQVRSRCMG